MVSLLLAIVYLAFISLGLPDGLLGAAWPTAYLEMQVPISWSGIVFMIISLGTICSSLLSDRMTRRFGAGKVTAVSVSMTAVAIMGFSVSTRFWMLCLWAIPYGLGAGSVDAALNNFVALHFKSHHMSWLHCMWGIGASAGPVLMGRALSGSMGWHGGYRSVGILQIMISVLLFASLPIWKIMDAGNRDGEAEDGKVLSLKEVLQIKGTPALMICFLCYCALEQTAILWSSSYLTFARGMDETTAARCGSLFLIGMTVGRLVSGFLTFRFSDKQMIRIGEGLIAIGMICLFLPLGQMCGLIGLLILGLGCAPIYPSIIHATPDYFGKERSQALIGIQMASAYVGTCTVPPVCGRLFQQIGFWAFPIVLVIFLIWMAVMHEKMLKTLGFK